MTVSNQPAQVAPRFSLRLRDLGLRGRSALPLSLLTLALLPLAGCLTTRVHRVNRTVLLTNVQNAGLDQLVAGLGSRDAAIQTLNATVEITASTGGVHQGQVKEIPTFSGYMFLRKPGDLRVLLLAPFVRSRALDMVTDGKNFKLLIPPRNRAIVGADEVIDKPAASGAQPAPGAPNMPAGLETIRPYIVRDSLLVPPPAPDEILTLTENSRIVPPAPGHKESTEEPDYDISLLRQIRGQVYERVRVIHIGRVDLLPYQQDLYDRQGRIVTTVLYNRYQKVSDIDYPMSILISRPFDEYTLKIEITKLQVNTKLDDEQFVLKIPDNVPVQKM